MINISTSLTKPGQPSPRFQVEAWLPFRNCEMVYYLRYANRRVLFKRANQLRMGLKSFGRINDPWAPRLNRENADNIRFQNSVEQFNSFVTVN